MRRSVSEEVSTPTRAISSLRDKAAGAHTALPTYGAASTLVHVTGSNFSAISAAEPSLSSDLVDEILGTHDPRMSNAGTLMLPLNAAIDIKMSRGKFGR
jgi:hypothetical protein